MPTHIYTVYIGHYKLPSEFKKDLRRMNDLGFNGYLFNLGDFYSIKAFTSYKEEQAKYAEGVLKKHNFDVFLEVKEIKPKE